MSANATSAIDALIDALNSVGDFNPKATGITRLLGDYYILFEDGKRREANSFQGRESVVTIIGKLKRECDQAEMAARLQPPAWHQQEQGVAVELPPPTPEPVAPASEVLPPSTPAMEPEPFRVDLGIPGVPVLTRPGVYTIGGNTPPGEAVPRLYDYIIANTKATNVSLVYTTPEQASLLNLFAIQNNLVILACPIKPWPPLLAGEVDPKTGGAKYSQRISPGLRDADGEWILGGDWHIGGRTLCSGRLLGDDAAWEADVKSIINPD